MANKQLVPIFLALIFGLFLSKVEAQQLQAGTERLSSSPIKSFDINSVHRTGSSRTTTCNTDTVEIARAEASGSLRPLSVYNVSSIDKAGQWFDAPQDITVYGFTFYAWKGSQGPGVTAKIICNMYLAGADSLPGTVPLASDTLEVDTFRTGTTTIGPYKKVAVFKTPQTVSVPYVLTVENDQAASVSVVANDWDNKDGKQKWLAMGHFPGSSTWTHSYDMTVSGVPFDADFVFEPHVRYDINASFDADTTCLYNGGTVSFTNHSVNPILNSIIYNQFAYVGQDSLNYAWEYGDSTATDFVFHGSHTYGMGTDYKVTLTANLVGWNTTCEDKAVAVINPMFSSDFDYTRSGLTVDLSDQSASSQSWLWDFGDGSTDSIQNPSHTYPNEGIFEVCLYTVNVCGVNDTSCKEVATCDSLDNNFSFNNDGLTMAFSAEAQTGATYAWEFGDGATSVERNPIHTYDTAGTYTVCLFLSSACFKDTSCLNFELVATGIDPNYLNQAKIYPNPFDDHLTIEFNEGVADVRLKLFNVHGKRIFEIDYLDKPHNKLNINTNGLPNGVYYLRIESSAGAFEQEVILIDE